MSEMLRNVGGQAAFFCYHSVAAPGPPLLSIAPDAFERHLQELRRGGWRTGDEQALAQIAEGIRPPRPTAFLTFDDGYVDNHEHVLPLLSSYGMTAFVFVVPPFVDAGAPLRWEGIEEAGREHPEVMRSMDWRMVEQLAEQRIAIGSHTLTHPHLTQTSDEQLRDELVDARRRIAERLGSCATLAYPYGDCDGRVRAAARDAGYRFAFTLPRDGQSDVDPLSIPRVAIDHRDSAIRFRLKLAPLMRRALLDPSERSRARRALRGGEQALRWARSTRRGAR